MMKYVCGFLFSQDRGVVCLIRKLKPAWQAHKLNGVGGKIEGPESPYAAMMREFREETGVSFTDWKELATLEGPDFHVTFFYGFSDEVYKCTSQEDEVVGLYSAHGIFNLPEVLPNLKVLIPLALDQSGLKKPVTLYDEMYDADDRRLSCFSSGKLCPQCQMPYIRLTKDAIHLEGRDLARERYYHGPEDLCVLVEKL